MYDIVLIEFSNSLKFQFLKILQKIDFSITDTVGLIYCFRR